MRMEPIRNIVLAIIVTAILSGCAVTASKFEIGQCLMPLSENSPEKIVKVVAATHDEYRLYTYFLSQGKLVQAQDYKPATVSEIESKYSEVECPTHDSVFSPNKYLNKNGK